ncbi:uncharacterized protein VTP21DRAFT_11165 [Calcarisporiella thermophila]|uniref:uncharacterized protein n=1 Tax=Calcarisporiella thermophila TaxID=911321 RepID=UPI003742AE1B
MAPSSNFSPAVAAASMAPLNPSAQPAFHVYDSSAASSRQSSLEPESGEDVDPSQQPLFLNFSSNQPSSAIKKTGGRKAKQSTYKVNGVNILNRNDVDSKTAIERILRRRENHNVVERRRRDNINNTILEISELVCPSSSSSSSDQKQRPNKGTVLRLAADYIRELQRENALLRQELMRRQLGGPSHASLRMNLPGEGPRFQQQPMPLPPGSFALGSMSMPNSPRMEYTNVGSTRGGIASTPSSPKNFTPLSNPQPQPGQQEIEELRLPPIVLPPATAVALTDGIKKSIGGSALWSVNREGRPLSGGRPGMPHIA